MQNVLLKNNFKNVSSKSRLSVEKLMRSSNAINHSLVLLSYKIHSFVH